MDFSADLCLSQADCKGIHTNTGVIEPEHLLPSTKVRTKTITLIRGNVYVQLATT